MCVCVYTPALAVGVCIIIWNHITYVFLGLIIEIIGQKYKRCKYAPLHIVRLTRWCSTNQISNDEIELN